MNATVETIDELKKIASFAVTERGKAPIAEDQPIGPGESVHHRGVAAVREVGV